MMRLLGRQEIIVYLLGLLCACVYGMKIDFSRLRQIRRPYIEKRNNQCSGNPCEEDKPFLCRSSPTCIALEQVCDSIPQCPDGFDESPALCNAKKRPSIGDLEDFLIKNEHWIIPALFNGASPELVAHSLVVSSDLEEVKLMVGMDPQSEENLHEAFMAVLTGDERPLLKMGMPQEEWFDVQFMLNRLIEGGLQV
ncbi:neuropeptide prohormone-4-like isoform X1 [Mytilus galloprovincialis]|uniref:Prohormone-4 n=1 Tax=Mytilus edulis TaxID=6550 RepID=A0A8S3TAK0_MYTED|nr:unnamed protein product [Mytilus edulis]